MLLAGFETISRRLFWSSYLLALDTAEQIRKRQEVAVFDPARVTTIDDLQHWPRLRQVMLEAKLLYPPETMVIRQALEPDTVCGESFGKGMPLLISPWVIHSHRNFWDKSATLVPDSFIGEALHWISEPGYIPLRQRSAHLQRGRLRTVRGVHRDGDAVEPDRVVLDDKLTALPIGSVNS